MPSVADSVENPSGCTAVTQASDCRRRCFLRECRAGCGPPPAHAGPSYRLHRTPASPRGRGRRVAAGEGAPPASLHPPPQAQPPTATQPPQAEGAGLALPGAVPPPPIPSHPPSPTLPPCPPARARPPHTSRPAVAQRCTLRVQGSPCLVSLCRFAAIRRRCRRPPYDAATRTYDLSPFFDRFNTPQQGPRPPVRPMPGRYALFPFVDLSIAPQTQAAPRFLRHGPPENRAHHSAQFKPNPRRGSTPQAAGAGPALPALAVTQ